MVGETKASCPQELAADQPVDWVARGVAVLAAGDWWDRAWVRGKGLPEDFLCTLFFVGPFQSRSPKSSARVLYLVARALIPGPQTRCADR